MDNLIKGFTKGIKRTGRRLGRQIKRTARRGLKRVTGMNFKDVENLFTQNTLGSSLQAKSPIQGVSIPELAFITKQSYNMYDSLTARNTINNFQLVEELTNTTNVAYYNPNNEMLVIAFRGTRDNVKDIMADIQYFVGLEYLSLKAKESKTFALSLNNTQIAQNSKQIVFVGHSLGCLPSYICYEFWTKNAYNPQVARFLGFNGIVPPAQFQSLPKSPNHKLDRVYNDIVSGKTPYGRNVNVYECPKGNDFESGIGVCHGLKGVWYKDKSSVIKNPQVDNTALEDL